MHAKSVALWLAVAGWAVLLLSPVITFLTAYLFPPSPMTFCGPEGGAFCLVRSWLPNLLLQYGMSASAIGFALMMLFVVTLVTSGVGVFLLHRGTVVISTILLILGSASCVILSLGYYLSPALMLAGGIVALVADRGDLKDKNRMQ